MTISAARVAEHRSKARISLFGSGAARPVMLCSQHRYMIEARQQLPWVDPSERGHEQMARILYLTATGPADPTRASLPFHLAVNGTTEAGDTAELVLAGDATELVKAGVADTVQGIGVPPLTELVAKATAKGVALHV
jgi:hypothetical protein